MNKAGLLATIIMVIAIITITMTMEDETLTNDDQTDNQTINQLTTYDERRINEQQEIDAERNETYENGDYTVENPLITVDPYGVTPLTALIMFETEDPTQITITVEGKDDEADISKEFSDFNTQHEIPVLGLYADSTNTVTVQATTEDGDTQTTELSIQTEALPDDFLTTEVAEADATKMEEGLTFIVPSTRYVYGVDHNADVRWYSTLWNSHVFKRLENGNILYITKEEGQDQYNELLEMDMLGKVENAYLVQLENYEDTNVVHHDVIELPNGNLLATTHDTSSDYIEDEMTEIDRETGETVRNFNFRDIFPASFYEDYYGASAADGDWFHQNAVYLDETDNTLLISSRHQDLTMKIGYPDGEIKWIMAAHDKWPEEFEQYLLEPQGDSLKFPAGPHAIMNIPDQDNDEATTDYLLFDNNIVITRGNKDVSEEFSRAVQYRINDEDMAIEEVWSFGEERGTNFYSNIVGDADFLPNTANRLITSGYITVEADEDARNSRIIEVTDQNPAEVVYEIIVSDFEEGSHRQAYRAERMRLYEE
ncbi:aryl-sulfate sulfotransferase [Oceanobacillus halotolerans]|uniref:aryl-sulfate sulfotransferase n=1 Tax=Oceanobacillus halotolerans TaxID=2663380 RepID=UPI0013DB8BA5|nr:aryl-sulfate sulfotransferase [Oceanobacillus halotolerans]